MKKLIFLVLIAFSWPSVAERWFEVEVIVFKRNINSNSMSEQWPDTQPDIDIDNAISLLSPASRKKYAMSLLPKNQRKLTETFNRLRKHADYTPLLHLAWRQNDSSRDRMPKIHFRAGENYQAKYYTDGTVISAESYPADFTEMSLTGQAKTTKINGPIYELDGFIRLYVQHYLFIETDLVLREVNKRRVLQDINVIQTEAPFFNKETTIIGDNPSSFAKNETPIFSGLQKPQRTYAIERYLTPYHFKQKRRMRSGEIHYLDHPKLGLIVQVRRIN